MFEISRTKVHLLFEMIVLTVIEALLCFYVVALLSRKIVRRNYKIARNVMKTPTVDMAVLLVRTSLDVFTGPFLLGSLGVLQWLHLWFNP